MRKTLLASAAVIALGCSGYAMANPCSDGDSSCNQKAYNGSNTATNDATSMQTSTTGNNANEITSGAKVAQDSFNTTKIVAASRLSGSVSGVAVWGIGNTAYNEGNANGGRGGNGAKGIGGKGGSALAVGGYGGDGGNGGKAIAGDGGNSRASGGDGGNAKSYAGDGGNARASGGKGSGSGGDAWSKGGSALAGSAAAGGDGRGSGKGTGLALGAGAGLGASGDLHSKANGGGG
ncbi:hypothetical protein G3O01_32965, partial [Burkholderia sp. Ac-20365]|nr:hypothetical protein [Burkholderia sp. Ac-20365]